MPWVKAKDAGQKDDFCTMASQGRCEANSKGSLGMMVACWPPPWKTVLVMRVQGFPYGAGPFRQRGPGAFMKAWICADGNAKLQPHRHFGEDTGGI